MSDSQPGEKNPDVRMSLFSVQVPNPITEKLKAQQTANALQKQDVTSNPPQGNKAATLPPPPSNNPPTQVAPSNTVQQKNSFFKSTMSRLSKIPNLPNFKKKEAPKKLQCINCRSFFESNGYTETDKCPSCQTIRSYGNISLGGKFLFLALL
jgi:hypothetical protein